MSCFVDFFVFFFGWDFGVCAVFVEVSVLLLCGTFHGLSGLLSL